jgi:hypothetical protein
MRLSRTAQVGIGTILVGLVLFSCARYWIQTRTLFPVGMSVSLSSGHLKTGEFKINIRAFYSILVVFPGGSEPNCNEYAVLRTRAISSIGGRTVTHLQWDHDIDDPSTTVGPFLGGFESKPGAYRLDVEVLSDASCLNTRRPHLEVIASSDDFTKWRDRYEGSFWISLSLVLVGILVTAVAIFGAHRRPIGDASDILGSNSNKS